MLLRFLLPDLDTVSRRSRRIVAGATGLMFTLLTVNIAHTQFGLGGAASDQLLNAWGQNVVLACACAIVAVRVRTGGAPGCKPLLAAITLWTVGNLWWGFVLYDMVDPPFPSPADAGWLAFYPVRLPLHRPAPARQRPRPPAQRLARRPGRDPLGRRHRRQHRRRAGPRRRGGDPGGRADERRLPARGPAPARPHGRGARPARTARRTGLGAPGGRLRALRRSPTRSTSRASPPTRTRPARCSTRCGSSRS